MYDNFKQILFFKGRKDNIWNKNSELTILEFVSYPQY